jgi:hypothetical protein
VKPRATSLRIMWVFSQKAWQRNDVAPGTSAWHESITASSDMPCVEPDKKFG